MTKAWSRWRRQALVALGGLLLGPLAGGAEHTVDEFSAFLSDIAATVEEMVETAPWRKRLAEALQRGEGDLLCDYQSDWLPGAFAWSRPFLPDQALLISAAATPAPASLAALAGQPVGTVRGYVYPEMSEALRAGFVRDDAPDAVANLQKMERGRIRHALTGRRVLEYQQRIGAVRLALHPPLVVSEVLAQCALSPSSPVGLAALNAAIDRLVAEGELDRILGKYR